MTPASSVLPTSHVAESPVSVEVASFRIVSFNVRGLRQDRHAVARVLADLDPDVACLQEAPKYLFWRGRTAALARESRLLYVGGGRSAGGAAMLSSIRVQVRSSAEHRLRPTPGLTRRGLVTATVVKSGVALHVASIHLGLDAAERARHVTDITGLINLVAPEADVVAGDMNETPAGATWQRLRTQYDIAGGDDPTPTFSTAHPRRRIDAVFVRGPVEVTSYQVLDTPDVRAASDHRPVVVDLDVRG